MWLFSQKGFFSIVQHRDKPHILIVKARMRGDIEKYWPDAVIERNEDFDYLYRTELYRHQVEPILLRMIQDVDYASFKGSLEDKRRYIWYVQLWEVLCLMQEAFLLEEKNNGIHDGIQRTNRDSTPAQ